MPVMTRYTFNLLQVLALVIRRTENLWNSAKIYYVALSHLLMHVSVHSISQREVVYCSHHEATKFNQACDSISFTSSSFTSKSSLLENVVVFVVNFVIRRWRQILITVSAHFVSFIIVSSPSLRPFEWAKMKIHSPKGWLINEKTTTFCVTERENDFTFFPRLLSTCCGTTLRVYHVAKVWFYYQYVCV